MARNAQNFVFIMLAALAALLAEPFARQFLPSPSQNG
jgi:hypothetical protein